VTFYAFKNFKGFEMPENQLIPTWDSLPVTLNWNEKIAYLTVQFLKLPQTDCPVTHRFENAVYIREMVIPAQTLFLGRAHIYGHECELVSGSLIHITPDSRRLVEAPFSMHTQPGYHMVFFALTEVIGRTYHPNPDEIRDVDFLENDIFEPLSALISQGEDVETRLLI
jgi:hypothetical protein